jgi:hypothetical protein
MEPCIDVIEDCRDDAIVFVDDLIFDIIATEAVLVRHVRDMDCVLHIKSRQG